MIFQAFILYQRALLLEQRTKSALCHLQRDDFSLDLSQAMQRRAAAPCRNSSIISFFFRQLFKTTILFWDIIRLFLRMFVVDILHRSMQKKLFFLVSQSRFCLRTESKTDWCCSNRLYITNGSLCTIMYPCTLVPATPHFGKIPGASTKNPHGLREI